MASTIGTAAVLPPGADVQGIAANPFTNTIYLAGQDFSSRFFLAVNGIDHTVTQLPTWVDVRGGIAVNATTNRIFMVGRNNGQLVLANVNPAQGHFATLTPIAVEPWSIAVNPAPTACTSGDSTARSSGSLPSWTATPASP